ncbi:MAG: hypothetical protein M1819_004939 [Sarea resinae]|nr:MAG: hypothetical protein M1819_004939 [Sarea resinae]
MASSTLSSSPHKPRRKQKKLGTSLPSSQHAHGTVVVDPATNVQKPAFPLAAFLWPARSIMSQWVVLPLVLMIVGLFRWATGLWGYSGFEAPPMHGDFEAQRHWMEITTQLPISQWYFHDLEWWGLDYPPLTAYHSWILGLSGSFINPTWFALRSSRGLDDPSLKVYMRATVLISEYLIYVPAVVIFLRRYSRLEGVNPWEASIALVAILMQPATLLIDHAHFQYNTVMLGFLLASLSSMLAGRTLWGSIFFVAALGFKQMALYYAPAIFVYLLGLCVIPRMDILRLSKIGFVTVASFAIVFAPLLLGAVYDYFRDVPADLSSASSQLTPPLLKALPIQISRAGLPYALLLQLSQSAHRIFPFARGLFEDKVANFWCALHIVHKLYQYPSALLQRVSLLATVAAISPPCAILFLRPRKELLLLTSATTAWGFFLFSFQVHEKSVLLPLLPMTALLGSNGGLTPAVRGWVGWANMLGSWTLYPLLKRDELRMPYYILNLLWAFLLGLPPMSLSAYFKGRRGGEGELSLPSRLLQLSFYIAMIAWHVLEAFVPTPAGKPDLWVVLNVGIGAAGFGICYLWCLWQLLQKSELLAWCQTSSEPTARGKAKIL